jgi:hypothetical protein
MTIEKRLNMSIRTIAIAAVIVAASTGMALAQSSPAPANQSGPSVSPTIHLEHLLLKFRLMDKRPID